MNTKRLTAASAVAGAWLALAPAALAGALIHPAYWTYQRWMDASAVPAPPDRIEFRLRGCTPTTSCVDYVPGGPHAIWLAQGDRATFLHEVGHVFDFSVLAAADRQSFARLAGRPGDAWLEGSPRTAELFASAYALCALDPLAPDAAVVQYGWRPPAPVHRAACELIQGAWWRWRLARPSVAPRAWRPRSVVEHPTIDRRRR